jgi:quinohemoprotein ethanol dehydrogenase
MRAPLGRLLFRSILLTIFLVHSLAASAETVVDDDALANEADGANWLAYGKTHSEKRYSPLDQINVETVSKLGIEWFLDLPRDRTLIGTPLAVDGVLYFTGSFSRTRAVDAKTGKLLWEYDPESPRHAGERLRIMWDSSRGLSYWKGMVIIATIDGRLVSIDAKTGKKIWETMTIDPKKAFYITGTPKVFRDKVIIGNGGTEFDAARGYVTAYHAATGELAWRFWIVPGNPADGFENKAMEMAAKTWTGEWWKLGGGGNTWNGITYDPEYNQIIMGTGNGSPWNRKIRSPGGGDNLFLCSLVAVDADTGEYKWHYQTVPGETWDYNSNMDIVLADLEIEGKTVKALMHAPKNGFFYVIDRKDGKLLSAEKIAKVTWATHIDLETGRPVETPDARYEDGEAEIWPSPYGAHSWHAMSFNPKTRLAYIPIIELPGFFKDTNIDLKNYEPPSFSIGLGVEYTTYDADKEIGSAALMAWDPIAKKKAWEVELPNNWNPGTMTTAGNLVFQGRADGEFVAYHAETGETLWSRSRGSGISAPPITYSVDGKQYVSLLVGWGGAGPAIGGSIHGKHGWAYGVHPRRLFTFALDGEVPTPPSPPPLVPKPVNVAGFELSDERAAAGGAIYESTCVLCHGGGVVSGGKAPDLRASPVATALPAFREVVRAGRQPLGMPSYPELSDEDIENVLHYIRARARAALQTASHD